MKLNFGLLGIALAQSGDDYSDERHDYSYDYNLGNSHYSGFGGDQSYSFNNFGGKLTASTQHVQARRLSCWNSNSLRDMNHDGKFFDQNNDRYHHYNHQYGFENAYYDHTGSHTSHELQDHGDVIGTGRDIDVSDDSHSVMAVDPNKWGYQSSNPDAKYHYGHHVHDGDRGDNVNRPHSYQIETNEGSFDGVVDDWRYSLRHAGCLYEAPDFFYSGDTFNALRYLSYGHDEHELGGGVTNHAAVTNVHWVHVFNAHLHIDTAGTYCSGSNHAITESSCINSDPVHQFAVVMANPTYEGLGFLNFVATYHDAHDPTNSVSSAGHRFRSNFEASAMYENSGYWHLSDIGTATAGNPTWHLPCNSGECSTVNWTSGSNRGLAISSFPHNQLGKDFRFNLRTLHTMGDGVARAVARAANSPNTAYSYFFYAISSIQVTFPEYVGHVNDCWRQRNGATCTADMIHQIIVDQSATQVTSASPQNTNGDIAYGNMQMMASLNGGDGRCGGSGGVGNGAHGSNKCASWCAQSGQKLNGHNSLTQTTITADGGGNDMCGNVLTISGMHRTYDELHMRQFGTIQEIWVQLQYAYSHNTVFNSPNSEGFESPFPNVFFSAPQVAGVTGSCSDASYGKCDGFQRSENVPYAGNDMDSMRWEEDADGLGSNRGDGFWVDDLDA